jgi:ACS family hexuronate transporter-like MFS transporter
MIADGVVAPARPKGLGYRWTVVALLFFATTVNYIDRQVLGILAPTLQKELHWSETQYGAIVSWFSTAYAVGLFLMGRFMDRVGVRRGLTAAVVTWSLAAMSHALARTATGFSLARAALGIGESANFPAAARTVADWFPKRERALAQGIYNAGSNVGVLLASLMVPFIALALGWRWVFVATGTLDFVWLAFWLVLYRDPDRHPRLTKEELAYIRSDPPDPQEKVPWLGLLRYRQTWAYIVGKSMTDPVWFFYLFWLPKFLDAKWGVKLAGLAAPLVVIYLVADLGSVGGGWLSTHLIGRGWSVNRGRKTAMLAAALAIVPAAFAPAAHSMWLAVAVVSVAAAAHQWWSANMFTLASDLFPRKAVASVVGLGGCLAMLAAVGFQRLTGVILDATGDNYAIIFVYCGMAYLLAIAAIHLLAPRMTPALGGAPGDAVRSTP